MNTRTRSILEHMLEDAEDVLSFVSQIETFEKFAESPLFRKAIVMSIINIGELTKLLPEDFKTAHGDIPWRKIAGMRDIAAHGYHVMDDEIIWDVAVHSVPDLAKFIRGCFI